MVKSVLSVSHRGLRDWVVQRVSAIYMAVYTLSLLAYLMFTPSLSFTEWHSLFAHTWMKIATILMLLGLLAHAWVGMWTILTDYIKLFILRAILECLFLLMLIACFFWGLMILWSV